MSENLRKFFAEVKTEKGQALTPSVLTGIRAAIHRHLTCPPLSQNINILTGIRAAIHRHLTSAPLSRNINVCQDSESMSANRMSVKAKAKLFTKENNVNQNKNYDSVRRHAGIELILHQYFMEGQNTESVWKEAEK